MSLKSLLILTLFTKILFAGEITIAVAANVSYAIQDIVKAFNQSNRNTKVRVILGSSGKLTAQIRHGAPYQLFMSADMKYPKLLFQNKIATSEPVVYAQGSLAYLSSKERDFSLGIFLLKEKNIKKIALANPKTAPYGIAAREAIENSGILKAISSKFVYGESVSQTVSYAVSAADIGLIAKSSLYSAQMKKYRENINWADVDTTLYTPISQGMVILKRGEDSVEVKAFYDFILGAVTQKILREYGYIVS